MTESPSVLHFLWSGEIGGAERAVYQLVREQRRRGTRAGVVFGRAVGFYADALRGLGCPVFSLDATGAGDLRALGSARRVVGGWDVHHFHIVEPLMFAGSTRAGSSTRVFTQRAGVQSGESFKKQLRRRVAKRQLQRRFHGWCGNTDYARSTLSQVYGIPASLIDVVRNGVEIDLLRPQRNSEEVRRSLGVGMDDFVVGVTASLKPWKRLHLLMQAAARLDGKHLAVVIVGDGPDRPRLEGVAKQLGIEQAVRFTGMQERVEDLVSAMDAFVLPSSKVETFGNSVVEAMVLGIPSVIFDDSPGLGEHIVSGRTGFVVKDVPELTHTLQTLRDDPNLRAGIGKAGAEYAAKTYGIERTADGYEGCYRKAMVRGKSGDGVSAALAREELSRGTQTPNA